MPHLGEDGDTPGEQVNGALFRQQVDSPLVPELCASARAACFCAFRRSCSSPELSTAVSCSLMSRFSVISAD